MDIEENLAERSKAIADKLVEAIKKDKQIQISSFLSSQAVKDSLPAICQTILQSLANQDLNFFNESKQALGIKHGFVRSKQDFNPREIAREFFLLKQIIITELKPQFLVTSPEEIITQMASLDRVIEQFMEYSFQSYTEVREKQLQDLHQQIFLTNQEVTRLVEFHRDSFSYLVHEIKNPLTSIIGYSDLFLRQQQITDNSVGNLVHIQQVLEQGRKVLRLINDTTEIASYNQGNFKLRVQQVNICNLLENITLGLKSSIEAKKLNLITTCNPQPLVIQSDSLRLQQIITNLLTNAIRYTRSGSIELTCSKTVENCLEIKVSDTGRGIAQSEQKQIFEPYFRSSQSLSQESGGVGLGLAIVSQLVTLLDGKIELFSEINVGSTFTIIIPLDRQYLAN